MDKNRASKTPTPSDSALHALTPYSVHVSTGQNHHKPQLHHKTQLKTHPPRAHHRPDSADGAQIQQTARNLYNGTASTVEESFTGWLRKKHARFNASRNVTGGRGEFHGLASQEARKVQRQSQLDRQSQNASRADFVRSTQGSTRFGTASTVAEWFTGRLRKKHARCQQVLS